MFPITKSSGVDSSIRSSSWIKKHSWNVFLFAPHYFI